MTDSTTSSSSLLLLLYTMHSENPQNRWTRILILWAQQNDSYPTQWPWSWNRTHELLCINLLLFSLSIIIICICVFIIHYSLLLLLRKLFLVLLLLPLPPVGCCCGCCYPLLKMNMLLYFMFTVSWYKRHIYTKQLWKFTFQVVHIFVSLYWKWSKMI